MRSGRKAGIPKRKSAQELGSASRAPLPSNSRGRSPVFLTRSTLPSGDRAATAKRAIEPGRALSQPPAMSSVPRPERDRAARKSPRSATFLPCEPHSGHRAPPSSLPHWRASGEQPSVPRRSLIPRAPPPGRTPAPLSPPQHSRPWRRAPRTATAPACPTPCAAAPTGPDRQESASSDGRAPFASPFRRRLRDPGRTVL